MTNGYWKKRLGTATLVAMWLAILSLNAQEAVTLRVLTIGNSFSEDAVEQNLYELGREAGYNLIIGNAYRGGQGLASHWTVVSQGAKVFEYRKVVDGVRTNHKEVALDSMLADEPWDIVTLQQVSQDAGLYMTYNPYIQDLLNYVRARCTNKAVRYGFHQTWAYARNATHQGFANYGGDQLRMYDNIIDAVGKALNDHHELMFVIPTGTAIQNARTSALGDHMNRDGYHLDRAVGRYVAACTWLEALTGVSPVGMKYHPAAISETVAAIAQRAAHDALLSPEKVTPQDYSYQLVDTCRISVFGSSVAKGTGATASHGYAWMYGQVLQQRHKSGKSPWPFTLSDISIGGNTTSNLLGRYNDLIFDLGRYVIFGVSLGNEGIHNSSRRQAIYEQWRNNMLRLIDMARADGKVPVVMNNYGRADFNSKDYHYVKKLNLDIHEWDVPSVNLLGTIHDGQGHWATGYESDPFHPNTAGHREMMYAIPPSLFDALAKGKPVPTRQEAEGMTLSRGNTMVIKPENTVHSFAVSLMLRGSDRGRILSLVVDGKRAWIGINREHKIYYCSTMGDSLVCQIPLEDKARHLVTLSHRYAQQRTLFFVDTERQVAHERIRLEKIIVGDSKNRNVKRRLSEVFFWRSALNADEVTALAKGAMLRSSLEVYTPLKAATRRDSLPNLAQSLNQLKFISR